MAGGPLLLPLNASVESPVERCCSSKTRAQGCFRLDRTREWGGSSFLLLLLAVPHTLLECEDQRQKPKQISTVLKEPRTVHRIGRCGFKAHVVTDLLWHLGEGWATGCSFVKW